MAEKSAIEWTDATINFWWGCTKVGPGCDHCYAETWDKRTGGDHWGKGVPRRKIVSAVKNALKLNASGIRHKVFMQSMSDLFDNEVQLKWFREAWETIEVCENLELQIVTKRVSIVEKRLAAIGRTTWPQHAGLIITVVNQEEADRDIPRLLALKDKFNIPWVGLSCEPLLGFIDLGKWIYEIDWVIVGGESGVNARPMHPNWARYIRDQCDAAGVPHLFKQWGEWLPGTFGPAPELRWQGKGPIWDANQFPSDWDNDPKWDDGMSYIDEGEQTFFYKAGKKASGRLLDGVEHNGFPNPPALARQFQRIGE